MVEYFLRNVSLLVFVCAGHDLPIVRDRKARRRIRNILQGYGGFAMRTAVALHSSWCMSTAPPPDTLKKHRVNYAFFMPDLVRVVSAGSEPRILSGRKPGAGSSTNTGALVRPLRTVQASKVRASIEHASSMHSPRPIAQATSVNLWSNSGCTSLPYVSTSPPRR